MHAGTRTSSSSCSGTVVVLLLLLLLALVRGGFLATRTGAVYRTLTTAKLWSAVDHVAAPAVRHKEGSTEYGGNKCKYTHPHELELEEARMVILVILRCDHWVYSIVPHSDHICRFAHSGTLCCVSFH